MVFNHPVFSNPKMQIKTNVLLKGVDKTMTLEEALTLKRAYELAKNSDEVKEAEASGGSVVSNLCSVSERQLREIHSAYGESGVFKLLFMAFSHNNGDFNHFFKLIDAGLTHSRVLRALSIEEELVCDNDKLPESKELDRFNLNVVQPSMSRKLYNPGRHHGYMVYGLGGPKILVSHPYQGISGEIYDVYNNSMDVVTSLMMRGYFGTFLFLDNMPGLNYEVEGVPAWALWFAIIAVHSDLVLYIKEYEEGFSQAQRKEIEFTPDRVQKKIIEIPHNELVWATKPDYDGEEILYITGEKGKSTKEDFYKFEAKEAEQFIEEYTSSGFPKDRLIRIDGNTLTEYPLDYPIYEPALL